MIVGLGTDIIEIARIKKAMTNERFLSKIFTESEIAYCQQKAQPEASFAARFAAKEAVAKAFGRGIGQIGWRDIIVVNHDNGQPSIALKHEALRLKEQLGIKTLWITLTHSRDYAVATAILEGNDHEVGNKPTNESH